MGFEDGIRVSKAPSSGIAYIRSKAKTRPPSAWNKFVKVKSKQKAFRFRDGKVNLKKIGVAWRKQKRR